MERSICLTFWCSGVLEIHAFCQHHVRKISNFYDENRAHPFCHNFAGTQPISTIHGLVEREHIGVSVDYESRRQVRQWTNRKRLFDEKFFFASDEIFSFSWPVLATVRLYL
ncbi:MAG: hypothetical protein GY820_45050 [Gammaproteobacteria bacterium]|nr:hypothetical protein [Gammaproteobacteria bacterium]